jgi:cytochrome oxidase Cu insertion factor (SCO1/SenC/PrrC family)
MTSPSPLQHDAQHRLSTPAVPEPAHRRWPTSRKPLLLALLGIVVAASVAFAILAARQRGATSATVPALERPSGIPPNISTPLANLMALSPTPTRTAPGFTLDDQHGKPFSLSSFRGRPVVLTFMDPHCVTLCPIVSQEFVDAERELAQTHTHAVFVAVNVNRHALSVATVAAFTKEHGLNAVPTWHFGTGTPATLRHIWSEYDIEVETRIVHGHWTVVHSSFIYFITPDGKERYLASAFDDHTKSGTAYLPAGQLGSWARGIALVAHDLAS